MQLHLVGKVNKQMVREVLDYLCVHKDLGIEVFICSEGGDAKCGLAIAGLLKAHKGTVITYAFGCIESAAVLIFAAGKYRRMSRMAWAMVHESSSEFEGNSTAVTHEIQQMEREDQYWNRFMEEFTGTAESVWADLDSNETYLTADECLKLNLATELI